MRDEQAEEEEEKDEKEKAKEQDEAKCMNRGHDPTHLY